MGSQRTRVSESALLKLEDIKMVCIAEPRKLESVGSSWNIYSRLDYTAHFISTHLMV